MNTESVGTYIADGCGRCEMYRTPQCKVHRWPEALVAIREILRGSELVETMKWGVPCYTLNGKNVVLVSALNDFCALGFFKGVLLPDPDGLLVKPGPNTQAARQLRFTSVEQVEEQRSAIARLVRAAVEVERSGKTVAFVREPEPVPAELRVLFEEDLVLASAFEALSPGRRRSYVLHVAGAKQAATRSRRAAKCIPKIMAGKGFHER